VVASNRFAAFLSEQLAPLGRVTMRRMFGKTGVFGSERLTGALLDRLTHHVHILELNGDSYRLKQSKRRQRQPQAAELSDTQTQA
jgi:TfoX/Sxy family transcriptional regulator of competence genes